MRRTLGLLAGLGVLVALLVAPTAFAMPGPYEPNDSSVAAWGPLVADQPYQGTIETASDRDYFYFYLTSPAAAQLNLTLKSLGGESGLSSIVATVLDSGATPLGALPYIADGENRTLALSLTPQKYLIEVAPGEGSGDSYELSVSASGGTIGTYAQVEGRCAHAQAKVRAAGAALQRAQSKLQRATARLRRSSYGSAKAKAKARAAQRKAKSAVSARARALRAARESQEPWCSIAR